VVLKRTRSFTSMKPLFRTLCTQAIEFLEALIIVWWRVFFQPAFANLFEIPQCARRQRIAGVDGDEIGRSLLSPMREISFVHMYGPIPI